MPQLTLYRADGACSLVPHILLTEFNIPFDEVLLKLNPPKGLEAADGSFSHEEYRKIHPLAYVPALKIDNEILTENVAIQTYIQTIAPENQLLGGTPLEKARVAEWLVYIASSLHTTGFGMFSRPGRFSDNEDDHDGIKNKGEKKMNECWAEIDKRIGDRDFAVGTQDTLADYYLLYFYAFVESDIIKADFNMGQYKNYSRLVKRVTQKDSVKKTMTKEGLKVPFS